MYNFDILFLDTTANKYYDRMTLEKQPLGGTEATVVRVAEGLAALGLKVAVMQSRVGYFPPTMGQHCFFLHSDESPNVSCRHYIQIRRNSHPEIFPGSKKYIWLHDIACYDENTWLPSLKEHGIKLIGVSQYHEKNIKDYTGYDNVTYIYNPVSDSIYNPGQAYDKHIMSWTASPHKGLDKALELFKKVRLKNPRMKLAVFNPGYQTIDSNKIALEPGVSLYGAMNCHSVWNVVQKSLCVFYPSPNWIETFGLIAAEANALGVPIATYRKGALTEIVSSEDQFVEDNDEDGIIQKVLTWSEIGRPNVVGRDRFRSTNIIFDWVRLLAEL